MDSVNPEWSLSAESPYDPPLTHGGWIKAQVLGEQIMKMLWNEHDNQHQHKKRKIVIHTSPYLRCTQSAVAVGAGISKAEGELTRVQAEQERAHSGRHYSSPARSRTLGSSSESSREIAQRVANRANLHRVGQFSKPTLRIDACFGEWGNADYFTLPDGSSHPPPDSTVMMAKAKAYLGQAAEDLQGVYYQGDIERRVHFQSPDRLNDKHTSSRPSSRSSPLSMGSLSESLPHNRLSTLSPISTSSSGTSTPTSRIPTPLPTDIRPARPALKGGRRTQYYEYPITSYAGSGRDYIPTGFVEHARDHCLIVDEQWDSMKEPQLWGHGGVVPEEWRCLHERMRKALHNMITWYTRHPATESPQSSDIDSPTSPGGTSSLNNGDEDTELVLVILTHQSGCNALAGAILNTPVLIDFAIASLSLAVLKDPSAPSRRPSTPGNNSTTPSAFDQYELKHTNYVEHLRPAPPAPSRRSSLGPIQTTPVTSKRPRATSYVVSRDPAHAAEMSAVAATAGLWGGQEADEEAGDIISPMMSESGGGLWLGRRESSGR